MDYSLVDSVLFMPMSINYYYLLFWMEDKQLDKSIGDYIYCICYQNNVFFRSYHCCVCVCVLFFLNCDDILFHPRTDFALSEYILYVIV